MMAKLSRELTKLYYPLSTKNFNQKPSDSLVELPVNEPTLLSSSTDKNDPMALTLHIEGPDNIHGSGVNIILTCPKGSRLSII